MFSGSGKFFRLKGILFNRETIGNKKKEYMRLLLQGEKYQILPGAGFNPLFLEFTAWY